MDVMEIPKETLIDEVTGFVGGSFYVDQAQQSEISLFI
jgi:peroxiredoxin family protein